MPESSLSIAGLHAHGAEGPWRAGPRAAIEWAASLGVRSLHLDASAPGVRARELDRSARRDLASTLRRNGLAFTGVDLWIPPEQYAEPATADRALAALLGAADLASELGGLLGARAPVVSVTLPAAYTGIGEIATRADAAGVLIEDFGADGGDESRPAMVRPGVDTGRLLMLGEPPGKTYARLARRLGSLRLNDADDTGRRPMGSGRLDLAMLLALHGTLTSDLPIVTDLRGLEHPERAARAVAERLSSGAV
jgi:sugar phosphate isomerase/epimerase